MLNQHHPRRLPSLRRAKGKRIPISDCGLRKPERFNRLRIANCGITQELGTFVTVSTCTKRLAPSSPDNSPAFSTLGFWPSTQDQSPAGTTEATDWPLRTEQVSAVPGGTSFLLAADEIQR